MRIADVLRGKGTQVATAGPTTTVVELLGLLAQYNVGALPVVDEDRLIGIVSERDVVRHLHDRGPDILGSQVTDVMVAEVVSCTPDDEAVSLARIMTDRRIRHIPVCRDGVLCGIVSIGDLVKARIDQLEQEREQLASYISQ
ncbi:MAG: histidine kinase [Pseudonocardia sp.]|jgi:CBS domain-containing protein|nr:histidine kinase [Pseudonocardia sp.]